MIGPPIKKWSFSAIKDFEECPYRIYLKRVERPPLPEPSPDSPLVRGDKIHKEAELFVQGEGPFTKNLKKFKDELELLQQAYTEGRVEVEQQWGYTREWAPVPWNNSNCWGMIKCDAVEHINDGRVLRIIDYKTGKRFGKEVPHQQQIQLYGISGFLRYPAVAIVQAELWYLDEGKTLKRSYDRASLPKLLPRWEQRANRLTNAMAFAPKPSRGRCRYCDYGVQNGTGHCPYAAGEL